MTTDIVQAEHNGATLFVGTTPTELISAATSAADALADVIHKKRLYQHIGQRDHVLVEGWQACGTLVGVFAVKDGGVRELSWPETISMTEDRSDTLARAQDEGLAYGFTAAYTAVKDGREVGWGEGRCTRAERNWRGRDDYALSSMAQTRGQSRALRQPLGFIVSLAGYATTPAEEMNGTLGPVSEFGPIASDDDVREAVTALQQILPSIDGHGFVRILARTFDGALPDVAAKTLKGLAWWITQPEATGNVRERTAPADKTEE